MEEPKKKFWKNINGAITLEFVFLIPIFFLIIFSIFEVCLSFITANTIRQEAEKISRKIKIGSFKTHNIYEEFCKKRFLLKSCENINIKINDFDTYEEALKYLKENENEIDSQQNIRYPHPETIFSPKKIIILSIHYKWRIFIKFLPHHIPTLKHGFMHHFIRKVWQNEDF